VYEGASEQVAIEALPPGLERDAVRLLASSLAASPLSRALIPGGLRRRVWTLSWGLRVQLPLAQRRGAVLAARQGARLEGVLVGAAPWGHPFPAPPLPQRIRTALLQGPAVAARLGEVFELLLERRPREAHWYLSLLAVRASSRGQGVGSALLANWLGQVDAAEGSAWLETDEPRNLPFYRAAGFAVDEELRLHGVPVWRLGREARPARGVR
jgi:GNAT superfamily N-acetyltransferase